MGTLTLVCVKTDGKLKIRFDNFTDDKGRIFTKIYCNKFTWKFPKFLKIEGRRYEVPESALNVFKEKNSTPYYIMIKKDIKIYEEISVIMPEKIFNYDDCVLCLDNTPSVLLLPCAHACYCRFCYNKIIENNREYPKKYKLQCPICKCKILTTINYEDKIEC